VSIKIVVADDDKLTISLLEHVLADHLFFVHSAADGMTALDLVIREKPDVLITDLVLPKLDGMELCRRVREDPALKQTKVIIMTAVYGGSTFRPLARDCGADEYIGKPINSTYLLEKLYKLTHGDGGPGKKER
jgi:two-component system cell cycle response regulator